MNLQVVNPYWARLSYRTFLIGPFFNCVKKNMNVILQREVNLLALLVLNLLIKLQGAGGVGSEQ